MDDKVFDDIEIAPPSVVKQAAATLPPRWPRHHSSKLSNRWLNGSGKIRLRNKRYGHTRKNRLPGALC